MEKGYGSRKAYRHGYEGRGVYRHISAGVWGGAMPWSTLVCCMSSESGCAVMATRPPWVRVKVSRSIISQDHDEAFWRGGAVVWVEGFVSRGSLPRAIVTLTVTLIVILMLTRTRTLILTLTLTLTG